MRTLRTRLVVATAAVLAVVLTALALFSARVTRIELRRLENVLVNERHVALSAEPVRVTLEEAYRAAGSWSGAQDALARAAAAAGREILVLDADGKTVARSAGLAHAAVTRIAGDTLRLDLSGPGAARVLIRAPGAPLHDGAGRVIGRFYLISAPHTAAEPVSDFAGSANRWLAGAAVAAGLAALFLIAALSRRLLGPIESLTDAARQMEQGNRLVRVPVASRDELGELARSFNSMADAISRQETLRRNLVSDVAHELRTPLTNMRGQLEALQDGLAALDRRTIDSLHDEARLLERLVDDLQDLALAEAGQLALQITPLSLRDAACRAAAAVEARARETGVEIAVAVPGDAVALADRGRVGQILSNLLGNALTHTPSGGRIEISAVRRGGAIETSVTDTGSGIAAEHLPHVFDRFYRTDASRTRATGGTGLGLAIVRQLVQAQRGDVKATSEQGRGTVVTFTLPAAEEGTIPLATS
jgi:signal transduction histidine kinase